MAVIIIHPTEELKLINLQKELISELFTEGRILVAAMPLWIPLVDSAETTTEHEKLKYQIELNNLEITDTEVFIPVTITSDKGKFSSKLTLVNLHRGRAFSDSDRKIISQKKQPVRQLKIFRLGIAQAEGPHAKSISDFVWCKLHNAAAAVK